MIAIKSNSFTPEISHVHRYFALIILAVTCLLSIQNTAIAGANLMITPSRVVFEDRTRSAQVTLMNTGNENGSFRISFIRQNMTDNGEFVEVKADEAGNYSDHMIRYSPRQITLPPGQSQVVRLMLRKPRDLAEGEYRSHMLFQTIPKASKSSIESALNSKQTGISIEITPIVGVSIPIIVRDGKLNSSLELSNAHLIPASDANPTPSIAVDMIRSGNQSVYGDFRAIYTPANSENNKPVVIALANGVAIYTPNTLRQFAIPLNIPAGFSLENGTVRVIFLESGLNEESGLIAETSLSF